MPRFSPAFVNLSRNSHSPARETGPQSCGPRTTTETFAGAIDTTRLKASTSAIRAQLGKTLSYLETTAQVLGLADRTAYWPGGFTDTHLAGNFTLAGKARWKWANRTVSPEKEWLECSCPMEQEESY